MVIAGLDSHCYADCHGLFGSWGDGGGLRRYQLLITDQEQWRMLSLAVSKKGISKINNRELTFFLDGPK
jgi:hypothetical protein